MASRTNRRFPSRKCTIESRGCALTWHKPAWMQRCSPRYTTSTSRRVALPAVRSERSGLAVGRSYWLSCGPLVAGEVVPQRVVDGFRIRKRIRQIRVDDDYVATGLESFCVLSAGAGSYECGRIFGPKIIVFMLIHRLAAHGVSSDERI